MNLRCDPPSNPFCIYYTSGPEASDNEYWLCRITYGRQDLAETSDGQQWEKAVVIILLLSLGLSTVARPEEKASSPFCRSDTKQCCPQWEASTWNCRNTWKSQTISRKAESFPGFLSLHIGVVQPSPLHEKCKSPRVLLTSPWNIFPARCVWLLVALSSGTGNKVGIKRASARIWVLTFLATI